MRSRVVRRGPQILTAVSAIALGAFTAPTGTLWTAVVLAVGIFSAACAVFWESRKADRLERVSLALATAESDLRDSRERRMELEDDARRAAHELLVAVAGICGGDPNDLRTSMYVRRAASWHRLGRYSASARHRESGREVIPLEEGLLHRAFDRSTADAKDLPNRDRAPVQYETEQCKLGLAPGRSQSLGMSSRSYLLFRIEGQPSATPGPTFVLCFESMDPQGLDPQGLADVFDPWRGALHIAFARVEALLTA
jgi:hypothetical protein